MKLSLLGFYKDITPDYLERKKKECDDISSLINEKDFTQLKEIFHKIAGSGGGYGIQEITNLAGQLEELSQKQEIVPIQDIFNEYKKYLDSLVLEFKE